MSNPGARTLTRHVLIVDDDDEPRVVLAIALGTIAGVVVETAKNATDALRIISAQAVDVLVTDFRMPDMSGLELLGALRERELWPMCGTIVISADTDPNLPQRARACGADLFCRKPISAGFVRQSVISLLEESHGKA